MFVVVFFFSTLNTFIYQEFEYLCFVFFSSWWSIVVYVTILIVYWSKFLSMIRQYSKNSRRKDIKSSNIPWSSFSSWCSSFFLLAPFFLYLYSFFISFQENVFVASLFDSFISNIHIYILLKETLSLSLSRSITSHSHSIHPVSKSDGPFLFFDQSVHEHSTLNQKKEVHGYCSCLVLFFCEYLCMIERFSSIGIYYVSFVLFIQRYLFAPVVSCLKEHKENIGFCF
jgi:hypothetical protein